MYHFTHSNTNSYKVEIAKVQNGKGYFIATVLKSSGTGFKTTVQTDGCDYIGYNYFNMARPYPKYIVPTIEAAIELANTQAAKNFKRETIVTENCPF